MTKKPASITLFLLAATMLLTGFAARDLSSYSDAELAQMYSARGMNDQALYHYGNAIAVTPDAPEPYLARAFFLLKLNRQKEALADLDRIIALQPDKAQHYLTRGMVYSENGDGNRAQKDFAEACRLGDQSGCTFMNEGR
jgi:tetratricopeptide (TPR) repeat protein